MGASASAEMDGARFAADVMPLRSFLGCEKQALKRRRCRGVFNDAARCPNTTDDIKPSGRGESVVCHASSARGPPRWYRPVAAYRDPHAQRYRPRSASKDSEDNKCTIDRGSAFLRFVAPFVYTFAQA